MKRQGWLAWFRSFGGGRCLVSRAGSATTESGSGSSAAHHARDWVFANGAWSPSGGSDSSSGASHAAVSYSASGSSSVASIALGENNEPLSEEDHTFSESVTQHVDSAFCSDTTSTPDSSGVLVPLGAAARSTIGGGTATVSEADDSLSGGYHVGHSSQHSYDSFSSDEESSQAFNADGTTSSSSTVSNDVEGDTTSTYGVDPYATTTSDSYGEDEPLTVAYAGFYASPFFLDASGVSRLGFLGSGPSSTYGGGLAPPEVAGQIAAPADGLLSVLGTADPLAPLKSLAPGGLASVTCLSANTRTSPHDSEARMVQETSAPADNAAPQGPRTKTLTTDEAAWAVVDKAKENAKQRHDNKRELFIPALATQYAQKSWMPANAWDRKSAYAGQFVIVDDLNDVLDVLRTLRRQIGSVDILELSGHALGSQGILIRWGRRFSAERQLETGSTTFNLTLHPEDAPSSLDTTSAEQFAQHLKVDNNFSNGALIILESCNLGNYTKGDGADKAASVAQIVANNTGLFVLTPGGYDHGQSMLFATDRARVSGLSDAGQTFWQWAEAGWTPEQKAQFEATAHNSEDHRWYLTKPDQLSWSDCPFDPG